LTGRRLTPPLCFEPLLQVRQAPASVLDLDLDLDHEFEAQPHSPKAITVAMNVVAREPLLNLLKNSIIMTLLSVDPSRENTPGAVFMDQNRGWLFQVRSRAPNWAGRRRERSL
jgi:hypothetical protein